MTLEYRKVTLHAINKDVKTSSKIHEEILKVIQYEQRISKRAFNNNTSILLFADNFLIQSLFM